MIMQPFAEAVAVCVVVEVVCAPPMVVAAGDAWRMVARRWWVVRLLSAVALLTVSALPFDETVEPIALAVVMALARLFDGKLLKEIRPDLGRSSALLDLLVGTCRAVEWAPFVLLAAVIAAMAIGIDLGPAAQVASLVLMIVEVTFVVIALQLGSMAFHHRRAVEAQAASFEDDLTGALNRRGLTAAADREFARARRTRRPICLAMIDLDGFKAVNDGLGHAAGDRLLERCAVAMQAALRRIDVLCRFGGDEFCILMPDTELEGGAILAERVRMALELAGREHGITGSLGVAGGPVEDAFTFDELVQQADRALYSAKCEGRNRVVVAREDAAQSTRWPTPGPVLSGDGAQTASEAM